MVDLKEKIIFGLENIPIRKRKKGSYDMPYQVVSQDIVVETDVCIVGSGASGAILANKIITGIPGFSGKKVVMLEKGGYYDPEDFNQREESMMRLLWKNSGLQFNDDLSLLIAQGECLGGSTTINDAVCFDPPKIVLDQWKGEGVTFDDGVWDRAIAEVKTKLSVTRLTDDEVAKNANAMKLKQACLNLGYRVVNNERNCSNCATCGTCHLGCHYETKKDMLSTYILDALSKSNSKEFKIYCNCDVRKINYENGLVTGVEGKFLEGGKEKFSIKVNSKVVIIAAGAIASSSILQNNNIAQGKAGVGLAVHPSTLVIAKFPESNGEVRASEGIPMAVSCDHFSVLNGVQKGGFMLESIFTPIYQFSLQLPYRDSQAHEDLMSKFQYYAMAGVLVRDEPHGVINLNKKGNPKIHYNLTTDEINDLTSGIRELAQLFFNSNAEEIIVGEKRFSTLVEIDGFINELRRDFEKNKHGLKLGSAHPQGGNKIGNDSNKCVADKNCKVYGFDNLLVCDASCFPSPVGVNPQITVMALATITAENILRTWDANFEGIQLSTYVGETCDITRPVFCGMDTLSIMFNQTRSTLPIADLVNTNNGSDSWKFDKNTLIITNKSHWRGFVPDYEMPFGQLLQDYFNWIKDYFTGFWKKFLLENGEIKGIMRIYQEPQTDFTVNPELQYNHEIFGDVIELTYPDVVNVYDLVKIVDKNTIIGKVFYSTGLRGVNDIELVTFCMTNNYPAEKMDEEDHEKIFSNHSDVTNLEDNLGYWSLRLVEEHLLGPVIKVFHFTKKTLEQDYPSSGSVEESEFDETTKQEILNEIKTKLPDLNSVEGNWSHEIKKTNEQFLIGKCISAEVDQIIDKLRGYLEEETIGGQIRRRYVIRYALTTAAGSWI